jgi:hypothetical protein
VLNPVPGKYLHRTVVHLNREINGELALTVAEDLAHVIVEAEHIGGNLKLLDGNTEQVWFFADRHRTSLSDDLGRMLLEDHRLLQ